MKKTIALLSALTLLFLCCACGQSTLGSFREIETIGTKHYHIICRKDDQLAPVINAAVKELAAGGTLSTISTQWLGGNVITLDGDASALASLEPESLKISRTLIFGVEENFRPMAYEIGGEYSGMSVDIGKQIGIFLNCPVVFQPIDPADVGAQLASGNIDCAIGFDPILLNAEKYDIGVSYMDSDIILAVPAESPVRSVKDLKDLRIGITEDPAVSSAVAASEKLTKYASGATVYLSTERCFSALDKSWCAAVAMDRLRVLFYPQL